MKIIDLLQLSVALSMSLSIKITMASDELPLLGQTVACQNDPRSWRRFRFLGNEVRFYHSQGIASSWGVSRENWRNAVKIDCHGLDKKRSMAMAPPIGKAVKCKNDDDPDKVYRFLGDKVVLYSSEEVATSWDPNWRQFETIPCAGLRNGVPEIMNEKGGFSTDNPSTAPTPDTNDQSFPPASEEEVEAIITTDETVDFTLATTSTPSTIVEQDQGQHGSVNDDTKTVASSTIPFTPTPSTIVEDDDQQHGSVTEDTKTVASSTIPFTSPALTINHVVVENENSLMSHTKQATSPVDGVTAATTTASSLRPVATREQNATKQTSLPSPLVETKEEEEEEEKEEHVMTHQHPLETKRKEKQGSATTTITTTTTTTTTTAKPSGSSTTPISWSWIVGGIVAALALVTLVTFFVVQAAKKKTQVKRNPWGKTKDVGHYDLDDDNRSEAKLPVACVELDLEKGAWDPSCMLNTRTTTTTTEMNEMKAVEHANANAVSVYIAKERVPSLTLSQMTGSIASLTSLG